MPLGKPDPLKPTHHLDCKSLVLEQNDRQVTGGCFAAGTSCVGPKLELNGCPETLARCICYRYVDGKLAWSCMSTDGCAGSMVLIKNRLCCFLNGCLDLLDWLCVAWIFEPIIRSKGGLLEGVICTGASARRSNKQNSTRCL